MSPYLDAGVGRVGISGAGGPKGLAPAKGVRGAVLLRIGHPPGYGIETFLFLDCNVQLGYALAEGDLYVWQVCHLDAVLDSVVYPVQPFQRLLLAHNYVAHFVVLYWL